MTEFTGYSFPLTSFSPSWALVTEVATKNKKQLKTSKTKLSKNKNGPKTKIIQKSKSSKTQSSKNQNRPKIKIFQKMSAIILAPQNIPRASHQRPLSSGIQSVRTKY